MVEATADPLDDLLAQAAIGDAARHDLRARMGARERHYHGLDHLRTLWSSHWRFAGSAGFDHPAAQRLVASAVALHDAVYVPGRADNEQRSAALWRDMARADLDPSEVGWVAAAILATANHRAAVDIAIHGIAGLLLWIVDLHLTPLGETAELFDHNTALLAREKQHADAGTLAAAQRRFLRVSCDWGCQGQAVPSRLKPFP